MRAAVIIGVIVLLVLGVALAVGAGSRTREGFGGIFHWPTEGVYGHTADINPFGNYAGYSGGDGSEYGPDFEF